MPRKWTGSKLVPFANARELGDSARLFYIIEARGHRAARGRFPEQCQFIIALDTVQGEKQKLTLAVSEDRLELEKFVKEDPTKPVGPCRIEAIEADTPSGFYWVIESIGDEEEKSLEETKPKGRKPRK